MGRDSIESFIILDAKTDTGAGSPHANSNSGEASKTFQAILSDTTTPSATVDIEVSNNKNQWIVMGTISLSGANDTDGFASSASWKYIRPNVKAISGASAAVTVTMGG